MKSWTAWLLGWPWQQLTQWQDFVDTCSSNANLKQRGNVSEESSHWHQPEVILDTALFNSRLLLIASSSLSSSSSSSSRSSPAWLSSKQTFWQVLMCSLTWTRGWTGWFTLYQLWARRKVQEEMGPGLRFRVEKGPKGKAIRWRSRIGGRKVWSLTESLKELFPSVKAYADPWRQDGVLKPLPSPHREGHLNQQWARFLNSLLYLHGWQKAGISIEESNGV